MLQENVNLMELTIKNKQKTIDELKNNVNLKIKYIYIFK